MGVNDDEDPRIAVTFVTTQNSASVQNKKQAAPVPQKRRASPTAQTQV